MTPKDRAKGRLQQIYKELNRHDDLIAQLITQRAILQRLIEAAIADPFVAMSGKDMDAPVAPPEVQIAQYADLGIRRESVGADEGILLVNGSALRGVLDWWQENAPNGEQQLHVVVRTHTALKSFGAK